MTDLGSRAAFPVVDIDALVKEGEEAYAQARYPVARQLFERVLEIQPDSARARQNLGVVYRALGDSVRARRELEAAVVCEPTGPIARINLAWVLAAQGDAPGALLQLAAALVGRDGERLLREQAAELAVLFEPSTVQVVAEASWRGLSIPALCRLGELLGIAVRERPGDLTRDRQLRRHLELIGFVHRHHAAPELELLDVGCGNGGVLRELDRLGFRRLHGCDLAPGIQSNDIPGLAVHRVDLDARGLDAYGDSSFDLIVCSDVLEHLERPALALREMARVMRPQGELFLTIPNAFNRFERIEILRTGNSSRYPRSAPDAHGHIGVLPTHVLASLCDRAGLEIREEGGGYCYLHGHFWYPRQTFAHADSYVCAYRVGKRQPA